MTAKLKSEEIWKCTIDWLANVKVDLFQYFCGFWSTRTLYYFPISVRPSITGVTCQLFSMIWWLRPRNHIFLNAYHQCWSLGWSEKPKSLKSKNGQADYLPRQNSFWNLDPTIRLLRNPPNAVYRKGYPFHKTKVKAFYRKEPQWPILGVLGGTENGTSGARIKILRPLFNTNTPPKTPI